MAAKLSAGFVGKSGSEPHLAALDLLNDRQQQILSRAEVVQQHSVACPDRGGYLAQRSVADAAGRELLNECIE